jgi:signal peptidase I
MNPQIQTPTSTGTQEKYSPNNWVDQSDITLTKDSVTISVDNPLWATFTDTNSMDPVLDESAHAIQIKPNQEDLQVGDIIAFTSDSNQYPIIHRVIEIGNDGDWYAITKGDNNEYTDRNKVRFKDIQAVVIGIIY